MAGKGSKPRRVDYKKFSDNWDYIFNKKKTIWNRVKELLPKIKK